VLDSGLVGVFVSRLDQVLAKKLRLLGATVGSRQGEGVGAGVGGRGGGVWGMGGLQKIVQYCMNLQYTVTADPNCLRREVGNWEWWGVRGRRFSCVWGWGRNGIWGKGGWG
jgi:hypothetical protein